MMPGANGAEVGVAVVQPVANVVTLFGLVPAPFPVGFDDGAAVAVAGENLLPDDRPVGG